MDVFDYHAALLLAEESTKGVSDKAKGYLRAACARVQLDAKSVDAHLASLRADIRIRQSFVPVQCAQFRAVAEYLLWLDVKLKRAEYCDFIRGISPVFLDLLEAAADKSCGIRIANFCETYRDGKRLMSPYKMNMSGKGKSVLAVLDLAFHHAGGFRESDLSPAQLVHIIEALSGDEKLKALVQRLRGAEQNCRNIAAHEIVSVTAEWIENRCGLTPQDILAGLNDLGEYAGIKRHVLKDSYEKMNELIKDSL